MFSSPGALIMTFSITALVTMAVTLLAGSSRAAHGLLAGIVLSLANASFVQTMEISPEEYRLVENDRRDCRVDTEVRRHLADRIIDQNEFLQIVDVIGQVRRDNARRIVNHDPVACGRTPDR